MLCCICKKEDDDTGKFAKIHGKSSSLDHDIHWDCLNQMIDIEPPEYLSARDFKCPVCQSSDISSTILNRYLLYDQLESDIYHNHVTSSKQCILRLSACPVFLLDKCLDILWMNLFKKTQNQTAELFKLVFRLGEIRTEHAQETALLLSAATGNHGVFKFFLQKYDSRNTLKSSVVYPDQTIMDSLSRIRAFVKSKIGMTKGSEEIIPIVSHAVQIRFNRSSLVCVIEALSSDK